MQRHKEHILLKRMQAALPPALGLCLISAMLIHVLLTLHVGFMSDDYALMHSARQGTQFWHLHSSPPLEFLWRMTAHGNVSAFTWHWAVLLVHMINVGLLYVLARRFCTLDMPFSLLAATFYALSPAGIEALVWTCAAGYVLTMTWILTALLCFLSWQQNNRWNPLYPSQDQASNVNPGQYVKGIVLAIMQLAAFLTWEWGVLLFPVLCVFYFAGERRGWKILAPVALCWLAAVAIRSFSSHGVFWQHNDLATAGRFFFGSPLLGLFPNLSKSAYFSIPILVLFAALVVLLAWAAWQQRMVLAFLVCFFGTVLPWVKGGNPSSRYFYLAMPFLYLAIVLALSKLKYQAAAWAIACLLLISQFWSTYERAVLWVEADHSAHALMDQVVVLLSSSPAEKQIVIVNVPEAYGPPDMPMRPQLWYCGFREYLSGKGLEVEVAKTDDSAFVWHKSPGRLPRQVVAATHSKALIYEVVFYHSKKSALVPFK